MLDLMVYLIVIKVLEFLMLICTITFGHVMLFFVNSKVVIHYLLLMLLVYMSL